MNEVKQVFNFNQHELTVITDAAGEPWFVGKEVCDILGIANARDAIAMLDDDERNTVALTDGNRGNPNKTIISESGLYSVIMSSRKKEAVTFRKWVTSEVLPAIRKTGKYELAEKTEMERLADAVILAHKVLADAKNKIQFYDKVAVSENTHLVREVAKILKLPYGQNIFYQKLKELQILMKNNEPYQAYVDAGYFQVLLREYTAGEKTMTSKTTVVTGKGIEWLEKRLAQVAEV